MARGTPPPPPPPPAYQPLQDAFLFSGDFAWMFYLCLAGFCFANAKAVLGASPKINYWHGCALMVLANYGGSTLAAIMCGKPVPFVCNEALVSVCLSVWTVAYLAPAAMNSALGSAAGRILSSITYEIMRCHVLMNCSKMAAASLPGSLPIAGPLIAGLLGGCGGGFMPLNKGLDPLAGGTNWRMASAAVNSLWLFLSTQYPASKAAIGIGGETASFLAVCFFVAVPLIETATGKCFLGANPLVPARATSAKKKN